jgi:hypothetical protein
MSKASQGSTSQKSTAQGSTAQESTAEKMKFYEERLKKQNLLEPVQKAFEAASAKEAFDDAKGTFTKEAEEFNKTFPEELQCDQDKITAWVDSVWPEIKDKVRIAYMRAVESYIEEEKDSFDDSDKQNLIDSIENDEDHLKDFIAKGTDGVFKAYIGKFFKSVYSEENQPNIEKYMMLQVLDFLVKTDEESSASIAEQFTDEDIEKYLKEIVDVIYESEDRAFIMNLLSAEIVSQFF